MLADYFRLSGEAVRRTLTSLLEAEVVERQATNRAYIWRIRPNIGYALAFSLGRTSLHAGLFDFDYKPVGPVRDHDLAEEDSDWEADDVYRAVAQLSTELLEAAEVDPAQVVGLSISIPAAVTRDRYPRAETTRFASPWSLHTLAREESLPVDRVLNALSNEGGLRDRLQGSHSQELVEGDRGALVSLINDANAAALGLVMWLRLHRVEPPPRDLLYVYVGEGIGAGAIVGHRPLFGGGGLAGEIGHIAVDPQADFCGRCGKRGCLEVVASGTTMAKRIAAAISTSRNSPQTYGEVLQSRGPQQRPHPVVPGVLRECGWHLGTRIAAVCNVLNPSLVVIDSKDLIEIERSRSRWKPGEEVNASLRPTESVAYQGAVLHGLERHALGPIRRHLSPPPVTQAGTPTPHDTSIAAPTLDRGVHFGTASLGIELPEDVGLPLLGAAADVFDAFADRYLARTLSTTTQ